MYFNTVGTVILVGSLFSVHGTETEMTILGRENIEPIVLLGGKAVTINRLIIKE